MTDSRTPLVLVGAGGHAKSVISTIVDSPEYRIVGLIDDGFASMPDRVLGFPVLGGRELLPKLKEQGIHNVHVCIGDNLVRGQMSRGLRTQGFDVVYLRHSSNFSGIGSEYGAGSFFHVYSLLGAECIAGVTAGVILTHQRRLKIDPPEAKWPPNQMTRAAADVDSGETRGNSCITWPRQQHSRHRKATRSVAQYRTAVPAGSDRCT